MTAGEHTGEWYEDTGELVAFLRAMKRGTMFKSDTLWQMLEKPWKWCDEHHAWVLLGRPDTFSPDSDTKGHER